MRTAGRPLAGASQYAIHFDKDELPPAVAFWSFTLYDKDGFAVPNPLNRATRSSWMDFEVQRAFQPFGRQR